MLVNIQDLKNSNSYSKEKTQVGGIWKELAEESIWT